ncbi:MAG: hypothetical protein FJ272_08450 [Planctomycetes bacterium]|nr:hypothetical protein [Planctomycetota bacterium]MBM4084804.1 hypothetical protein [Planctomycetota bacterium]
MVTGHWSFGLLSPPAQAEDAIKHRFLAVDESRSKLHYVDQFDPAKDWTMQLPGHYRDIQLVGGNRVLLSTGNGYREYDLGTREMVKEVADARFNGTFAARRIANGHTVICCERGKKLVELDAEDKVLREAAFPTFDHTRLARLTSAGTVLMGSVANKAAEVSLDGKVLRELEVPDAAYVYQAVRMPSGNLLVATGYKCTLEEYDGSGQCVWKAGGKPAPQGLFYFFFAGMQVLKNGDIVVSNWTGHGADDSRKGVQLIQFNRQGQVVWKWHAPERAGTLHGVIVLDDLDTNVLNDDGDGVLGPVKK